MYANAPCLNPLQLGTVVEVNFSFKSCMASAQAMTAVNNLVLRILGETHYTSVVLVKIVKV